MTGETAALEISNIEVVYSHSIQALRGRSMRVEAGSVVALLGSNGAGKTTTLKAASGILPFENGRVSSGAISYFGESILARPSHALARSGLAHVREGRHVFQELTVEENLTAAEAALKGRSGVTASRDIAYEYFPRLKERRRQVSGYLSGGEQQMLAIARCIIGQPRLILLDEPSLGLAPLIVEDIFEKITRINREQKTAMLIVEQNAQIALRTADTAYIMENGRIVINGDTKTLMRDADVRRFYLGLEDGGESKAGFRDVKHYKRRKRWLS